MNGLYIVLIAALVLILCYRYYGAFIAAKVLSLDPNRPTPAVRLQDGHDYVPTNKWMTFGHHFAAIAGAGPLVGPVLAAQFGYLPGLLWILIGACLAGAVHDIVILFASIRHNGLSIAEIASKEIGKSTGVVTGISVILIWVVAMAGMAIAMSNALFNSPWGTFSVAATIPIAIFVGVYLRYLRPGKIKEATLIGIVLVILGVLIGPWVEHSQFAAWFTLSRKELAVLLPMYGCIASVLPLWFLLVPRDYLSTYMKIGVIFALALGIILIRPEIHMPALTPFISGGGPVVPGPVWPFVCITIACGAISGGHAVFASGTTSKMITNEREILPIGFGAMLVEAFVSITALIAATSLFPADYFAINCAPETFASLGMQVRELPELSKMVGEDIAGRPGGAVSLAVGMAHIFSKIPFLNGLMAILYHFAIMFEALFILTVIDAGTRAGRYLLQEMGGYIWKPLGNVHWIPGILFTGILISLSWGYLVFQGTIASIWPVFGLANQLLASMALAIGTTVLFHMGKKKYVWITLAPLCFMFVTALTAGVYNIFVFFLPKHQYLLAAVSALMMIMIIYVICCSVKAWIRLSNSHDVSLTAHSDLQ